MFDPENVERLQIVDAQRMDGTWYPEEAIGVLASDYDQLLALYRKLSSRLNCAPSEDQISTLDDCNRTMDRVLALFTEPGCNSANHTAMGATCVNRSSDMVPGASYNYGSKDDCMFNPPNGTPRP